MYRGFNVENISIDNFSIDDFLYADISCNDLLYDDMTEIVFDVAKKFDAQFPKRAIHENLKKYCTMNGNFDASAIQEDLFPQLDFDVFISHSHDDEILAKVFAWYLQKNFNLKVFVDSAVWGYFDIFLKEMRCNTGLSNAVSHAHMMLTMALMTMIDRTECLFFLNTPKSINLDEKFNTGTYSPWLYTEIGISRMIEKKLSDRYKNRSVEDYQKKFPEDAKFLYKLNLAHLTPLDYKRLNSWKSHCQKTVEHPLDVLYKLYPLESKN